MASGKRGRLASPASRLARDALRAEGGRRRAEIDLFAVQKAPDCLGPRLVSALGLLRECPIHEPYLQFEQRRVLCPFRRCAGAKQEDVGHGVVLHFDELGGIVQIELRNGRQRLSREVALHGTPPAG